jgi:glycosyltransferase involved in cell wall biosynthesis
MRVLQIIPSYPPTTAYTGPPAMLHRLCLELIKGGMHVKVATTNTNYRTKLSVPSDRWTNCEGVPVFYGNRWGWKGILSPALHRCIQGQVPQADLVHVTAIYSWPILSASSACRRSGVPLVLSPRGSFAPAALAWHPWKKRALKALFGERMFRSVTAFHATTAEEERDILALVPSARVGRVPNGVDIPEEGDLRLMKERPGKPYILYLGRLHPHKNVDLLIRAWGEVAPSFPDAELVIAGPDYEGIQGDLQKLSEGLGLAGSVRFVGRKDGEEKSRFLARACALALPSKSENFGNVVAEAMAHATPVITSTGTPWREAAERGCGWWVEARMEPLAGALRGALEMEGDALAAMGVKARNWMREEFSWGAVSNRMAEFYGGVINDWK